jgi:hypothetical protein
MSISVALAREGELIGTTLEIGSLGTGFARE